MSCIRINFAKQGISTDDVLTMRVKPKTKGGVADLFQPYEPAKGVLPSGSSARKMAMDAGFDPTSLGSLALLENVNSAYQDGFAFPGFQILSQWAQVPEFRKPSETFAKEMTRKWIKLQATGGEDKSDKLKLIDAEFKRLNVQAKFREAIEQDGFFGRSHIFVDVGMESDQIDPEELKTELIESPAKVGKNSIKRLTVIEPVWTYPNRYNANDPLDPTFYKPISWFVMGKEIHSSRLLTVVTREVPDILKPAYAFAGLSLSQMMKPYVDNWLRTRQSVSDLVHSFTVWTLKTDMSTLLLGGGADSFFNRLQIFNLGRDNHGVNAINEATEDFSNVSAPLGGLDHLQNQAVEQMCIPSGIPLVYFTGITPSGLNASSDGEIRVFQDGVSSKQEMLTPILSKILNLVQLSLFGEKDPEIGFIWEPMYSLSELEKATLRKTEADTDMVYVDGGIVSPEEVRKRVANEEDSPYQGLEVNGLPQQPLEDPSRHWRDC